MRIDENSGSEECEEIEKEALGFELSRHSKDPCGVELQLQKNYDLFRVLLSSCVLITFNYVRF